jgi:hypothetical protein
MKEISEVEETVHVVLKYPQRRQSAKLFLQSSELGLPHSLTRKRVCNPPPPAPFGPLHPGGGGAHSLSGEGMGESQFRREAIHKYIYIVVQKLQVERGRAAE